MFKNVINVIKEVRYANWHYKQLPLKLCCPTKIPQQHYFHPFPKDSLFVQALAPPHFKPEHRLPPLPFCRHWHFCGLIVNSWNSSSWTPNLAENSQIVGQVNSNVGTRWHWESAVGCRTSFLSGESHLLHFETAESIPLLTPLILSATSMNAGMQSRAYK